MRTSVIPTVIFSAACAYLGASGEGRTAPPPPRYRLIVNSQNTAMKLGRKFLSDAFLKKVTRWPAGEAIHPVEQPTDSAVLASLLTVVVALRTARWVDERLASIEARYLPMIELAPRLEADLSALHRALQDAVASQDKEALAATRSLERRFLASIEQSAPI